MPNLVTIFGGSGFVGRYIARRMAKQGWRVRIAVRRPNEAMFTKPYGAVGQVEPVFANIRDDKSVAAALAGADAVVNCVGSFETGGANNTEAVQAEGAGRVARLAAMAGIETMVHISAIGANADSDCLYLRSKAEGEAAVLANMPNAQILRPSVVFGPEDQFFNRFGSMARLSPLFLPIAGGSTLFQPVYVDDVAAAAELGAMGQASGVFELGGPDVDTFTGWMQRMLDVINRRKIIVDLPKPLAGLMAFGFDMAQAVSLGLFKNSVLTRDQLKALAVDSVVGADARGFDELGLVAKSTDSILPDYLWRFRPSGQFDAIKNSAKNLRT